MPAPPPGPVDDDVLDRQARLLAQPLDEVAAQPAGAERLERRDDDLVDALVVHGLHRRAERIGMRDLAVRVDPLAAQLSERALQPPLGLGMLARRRVALRRDDEEARRPRRGALADLRQQRLADHGLVRDHEDVLLVRPVAARDEVLDRHGACGGADPVEHAAAQPARLLLGMRRDEDLVDGRLERRERVADGGRGIRLDDVAVGRDPGLAQMVERPLEAAPRRRAARVGVDDVARAAARSPARRQ